MERRLPIGDHMERLAGFQRVLGLWALREQKLLAVGGGRILGHRTVHRNARLKQEFRRRSDTGPGPCELAPCEPSTATKSTTHGRAGRQAARGIAGGRIRNRPRRGRPGIDSSRLKIFLSQLISITCSQSGAPAAPAFSAPACYRQIEGRPLRPAQRAPQSLLSFVATKRCN